MFWLQIHNELIYLQGILFISQFKVLSFYYHSYKEAGTTDT